MDNKNSSKINKVCKKNKDKYINYKYVVDSENFISYTKLKRTFSDMDANEWNSLIESNEKLKIILDELNNFLYKSTLSSINSQKENFQIDFINKVDGTEFIIDLENVVCHSMKNIDFENLHKINIGFEYSMAQDYSIRLGKNMLGLYLWDKHDEVMPKGLFITERVKVGIFDSKSFDEANKNYLDVIFADLCKRKNLDE